MGVWAQEKADRHAGRAAFRHCMERPPRYPCDDGITHHVYYGEHIIQGDIRAHATTVARARHVSDWCSKPSQGALLRAAMTSKRKPLPRHVGPKTPRWATSFSTAFATNTLATPARNRGCGGTECPLCGHATADLRHIMLDCGHHKMVEIRRAMGAKMGLMMMASPRVHAVHGEYASHPIASVPTSNIYPYADGYPDDMEDGGDKYVLDGLPEGRWYKTSKRPGSITVYYPGNYTIPGGLKPLHVSKGCFWRLVAWHPITTTGEPYPKAFYDGRARDIYRAIEMSQETSGKPSLCWATHRALLHIFVDRLGCETELFCNILNTFHRFTERRMIETIQCYENSAGARRDGFKEEAFVGSVYGNPPFDGRFVEANGAGAISRTLNAAEKAAEEKIGFRGVFVVPLSSHALAARERHPRAKVLLFCQDNTVPFVPDGVWYGKARYTGRCYKEAHTNLVVIMYESVDAGNLSPIDWCSLERDLASWYASVMPNTADKQAAYRGSRIPMERYEGLGGYPDEWRFWAGKEVHALQGNESYMGASHDSEMFGDTPVLDIVRWDPMLAFMGVLPDSFRDFLHILGHPAGDRARVQRTVEGALTEYARAAWKQYKRCSRDDGTMFREEGLGVT